jgi:hypothetical protein
MSARKKQRIRLASRLHGVNLHRLHREILEVLDSSGQLEPVLAEPTVGLDGYNIWSSPYFLTKRHLPVVRAILSSEAPSCCRAKAIDRTARTRLKYTSGASSFDSRCDRAAWTVLGPIASKILRGMRDA